MADFVYLAGPWVWRRNCWAPPRGCRSGLDLARRSDFGRPGKERPCGLFLLDPGQPIPDGYAVLRSAGDAREIKPGGRDRDALRSVLGSPPLAGDTLADLLWDLLTRHACPRGEGSAAPLVPAKGLLVLALPGHGRVRAEAFRWGAHPHTNRLRDRLRHAHAKVRARHDDDTSRRHLGALVATYPGMDWREIDPDSLPLPPHTTITESFDKADSGTVGPDLSWINTSDLDAWEVKGNQVRIAADDNSQTWESLRADTALSSTDLYAELTNSVLADGSATDLALGVTTRHGADDTFYAHILEAPSATPSQTSLYRFNARTPTLLSTAFDTWALGAVVWCRALGTTISGQATGTSLLEQTDTDTGPDGNLKCGLAGYGRDGTTAELRGDSFLATDGSETVTARPQAVFASGPRSTVSASASVTGRPATGALAAGPRASVITDAFGDSASVRPNGAWVGAGPAAVLAVTDATVPATPGGASAFGAPGLSANDSVATVRPGGLLFAAARQSVGISSAAAAAPRGSSAGAGRAGILNSPAVAVRPQGVSLAGGAATVQLSPAVFLQPPGLYASGVALAVTASSTATIRPQSLLASAPTLPIQLIHAVSARAQFAVATSPSLTVVATNAATGRPQGLLVTGPVTGAVAGGASAAALPQSILIASPSLTATSSPQIVALPRPLLATAPRSGTLTGTVAITVSPQALLVCAPTVTVVSPPAVTVLPGWVLASTARNVAGVDVVANAWRFPAPNGLYLGAARAGVAVGPDVPTVTGARQVGASGAQAVVSAGMAAPVMPQGATLAGARSAAGTSAAPEVRPTGAFAGGRAMTITVPASVGASPGSAFASAPLLGPLLGTAAVQPAPGCLSAGGPQARPFARAGDLYWIPAEGLWDTPVDASGHIDQEPPP